MKFKPPRMVSISPQTAKKWLETKNAHNRPLSATRVRNYALDMKAGAWALTHQGIAFDEHGMLIDGQHRLAAIVESGVTIVMWVWYGVTAEQHMETVVKTQDCVDRNMVRNNGQQLAMNGVTNAKAVAAACKVIRDIAIDENGSAMSMAQVGFVLDRYGKHITAALSVNWPLSMRRASLFGTIAFCRAVNIAKVDAFASSLASMDSVKKTSPVHALWLWNDRHGSTSGSSGQRRTFCDVVASCVRAFIEDRPMNRVVSNSEAMAYFRHFQKANVADICAISGVPLSRSAT